MKYRAEIDGLRAVAVLPVILFHAGFEFFSGGFVGVDVFFVISGYLITTILIHDIENNQFSLINFYERRARRILPALFFVMFVCLPIAWLWMLPSQLKDFSHSLIAVSLFASNILFWRESGYFSTTAEEKPLLHTWSLAVEEQYYVLFPIFLFFAWRFGKNRVFWIIVVMAALSLALSEWGLRNRPTANFYLAPTRAWELLAGSIAAFIVQQRGVQSNNFLSLAGFGAILFAIFFYDEATPFPSVYALVPVIGVMLLVLFAGKETLVAKLLSAKGFVGIGLISYSAYLWHQPLFAFARIRSLSHPSLELMAALAIASIILAWLSWKYIEQPFRKSGKTERSQIFTYSAVGLFAFIVIGCVGHYNNGFENRMSAKEMPFYTFSDSEGDCFGRINQFCNEDDKRRKIVVLGDSTIHPLATALNDYQNEFAVVPITAPRCIVVKGYRFSSKDTHIEKDCPVDRYETAINYIESLNNPIIVYGGVFNLALTNTLLRENGERISANSKFVQTTSNKNLEEAMIETVESLSKIAQTTFIVEFPEFGIDTQEQLMKLSLFSGGEPPSITFPEQELRQFKNGSMSFLLNFDGQSNITVIDAFDLMCSDNKVCSPIKNGVQLYTDYVHPSEVLSRDLASIILGDLQF